MEKVKSLMWVLIFVVVGLNLLDMNFTMVGIEIFGLSSEGNFIVREIFVISPLLWWNVKLVSSFFILFLGFDYEKKNKARHYLFANMVYGMFVGFFNFLNMVWFVVLLGKI